MREMWIGGWPDGGMERARVRHLYGSSNRLGLLLRTRVGLERPTPKSFANGLLDVKIFYTDTPSDDEYKYLFQLIVCWQISNCRLMVG